MVPRSMFFVISMLSRPVHAGPWHGFRLRELPETHKGLIARTRGAPRATAGPPLPLFGWLKVPSQDCGLVASAYAEQIGPIYDESTTNIISDGNITDIHTRPPDIPSDLHQFVPSAFVGVLQISETELERMSYFERMWALVSVVVLFVWLFNTAPIIAYGIAKTIICNMPAWAEWSVLFIAFVIPWVYAGIRTIFPAWRAYFTRSKMSHEHTEEISLRLAILITWVLVVASSSSFAPVVCSVVEATLLLLMYVGIIASCTGPFAFGAYRAPSASKSPPARPSGDEIFGICPPLPRVYHQACATTQSADAQIAFVFAETILLPIYYLFGLVASFTSFITASFKYILSTRLARLVWHLLNCAWRDALWLLGGVMSLGGIVIFGIRTALWRANVVPSQPERPLRRLVYTMIIQERWRRIMASRFPKRPADVYVVNPSGTAWPTQRVYLRGTPFFYLSSVFRPTRRRFHTWRDGATPRVPCELFGHHQRERSSLGFQPSGSRFGTTWHEPLMTESKTDTVHLPMPPSPTDHHRSRLAIPSPLMRHLLWLMLIFTQIDLGAGDDTSSSRPPVFSGNRVDWTAHVIALFGWVA